MRTHAVTEQAAAGSLMTNTTFYSPQIIIIIFLLSKIKVFVIFFNNHLSYVIICFRLVCNRGVGGGGKVHCIVC